MTELQVIIEFMYRLGRRGTESIKVLHVEVDCTCRYWPDASINSPYADNDSVVRAA